LPETVFLVGFDVEARVRVRGALPPARHVVELTDAEAALEALERGRPDLVVLDFPQPFRDGRSLTRALRSDPRTADTPIVAVSGWDYRRTRETAMRLGCTAFVAAAASEEELRRVIRGAVPRRAGAAEALAGANVA
jgi:CheY-like chemotaxis protein